MRRRVVWQNQIKRGDPWAQNTQGLGHRFYQENYIQVNIVESWSHLPLWVCFSFLPLSRSLQDLPLLAGCQALNSWVIWSSLSPIPPSIPHNPVPTYLLTSLCLMPDFCILLSSGDFSEMKIWMVTSWMTVLAFPEITPVQSLQTLPVQVQGQLCFSPVLQSQKHLKHFVSVSLPVKWRWQ